MGNLLKAKCNCGYELKNLGFGGNKSNYKTVCMVPALLPDGRLQSLNHFENQATGIIFYTDATLKGPPSAKSPHRDFNLLLQADNNYCPGCKNFSMSFLITHYTD